MKYNLYESGDLTNKDNLILAYKRKGENYEFLIFNPVTTISNGVARTSHICPDMDLPSLMTYMQFINYLYSELYINNGEHKSLQKTKLKTNNYGTTRIKKIYV
jgi:hypothetical protein